jgi:hypothetical protein
MDMGTLRGAGIVQGTASDAAELPVTYAVAVAIRY